MCLLIISSLNIFLIFSENSKIVNKSNKINSILKIKNAQIIEMDTENV